MSDIIIAGLLMGGIIGLPIGLIFAMGGIRGGAKCYHSLSAVPSFSVWAFCLDWTTPMTALLSTMAYASSVAENIA